MKLVKINGAVLSMNINHSSTHLAVGSDQGQASVFNINGPTLIYQKHIASEISAGIKSLQFQTFSLHGFEKNILAVGTKDSSVLALDSETGNTLSNGTVHPKKLAKALFMQVLGSITKDGLDLSEGSHIEDATTKQLYILLCSEKALYVYSLVHVVQGVKKVLYKKKFHSSSCCWASIFNGPSDIDLVLLFASGKVELSMETITLGDKRIGIKTSVLEEKATACNMLCCYADELKEGFFPWIDQVLFQEPDTEICASMLDSLNECLQVEFISLKYTVFFVLEDFGFCLVHR